MISQSRDEHWEPEPLPQKFQPHLVSLAKLKYFYKSEILEVREMPGAPWKQCGQKQQARGSCSDCGDGLGGPGSEIAVSCCPAHSAEPLLRDEALFSRVEKAV